MNFFKRAWLSMKARKGRSVLQLIIFTVVCVLILSGFTIQSAADKASELAREQLGGTVTLTVDREKQMQTMREEASSSDSSSTESKPQFQSSPIDVSDANDLAKLNHVASYNYYSSTQALASGFDPIESSGDTSSSNNESSTTAETQGPGGGQGGPQMVDADLSISGLLDSATSTDFEAGTSELTSGVAITSADKDKNVAMVEENLAEENDWKVGDSFTVTSSDGNTKVTLKIVGIYKTTDSGSDMAQNFSFLNPYNKVYVPYTVANTIKGSDYKNTVDSAVYTMDDAANISAFEKEAKKVDSIDWDTFKLDANDTLYQQMIGPINSVASFSKNVVYIVSIAGALILGLLVMMQVRDRKYEMGVLLAIGEKRGKLIAQFFVEILIVALVSFGLAAASSHYVAQLAGNQLLAQQNSSTNETTTSTENRGPGGGGQGGPGGFGESVSNLTQTRNKSKS